MNWKKNLKPEYGGYTHHHVLEPDINYRATHICGEYITGNGKFFNDRDYLLCRCSSSYPAYGWTITEETKCNTV